MNLDELKLGEIKQLINLFGQTKSNDPARGMIGKTCMFRTYSAGVHFGELVEKEGQTCLVSNSQRIFYWTEACSLSQLAMEGSRNFDGCKISVPVDEILLEQVIEIIPMPAGTVKAFRSAKVWKK